MKWILRRGLGDSSSREKPMPVLIQCPCGWQFKIVSGGPVDPAILFAAERRHRAEAHTRDDIWTGMDRERANPKENSA